MARFNSPLDNVRVAAPCSSDWNQMVGTERVRFCAQCNLNVYNLSSMKRSEAEALISEAEGRLCVRYYRRRDGTILMNNCPVGLRAIKRKLSRAATATLSAVLGFFAGLGIYGGTTIEAPGLYTNTVGAVSLPQDINSIDPGIMGKYEGGQVVTGTLAAPPELGAKFKARKARKR